jgi:hypothetical protein
VVLNGLIELREPDVADEDCLSRWFWGLADTKPTDGASGVRWFWPVFAQEMRDFWRKMAVRRANEIDNFPDNSSGW